MAENRGVPGSSPGLAISEVPAYVPDWDDCRGALKNLRGGRFLRHVLFTS